MRHGHGNDEHPDEKDDADNPEAENGIPGLTDAMLLEPDKGVNVLAVHRHIHDLCLAVAVDPIGAEELDCRLNDAGEVEGKEDCGEDDDEKG